MTRHGLTRQRVSALAATILLSLPSAAAATKAPASLADATQDLARGHTSRAIASLEELADAGRAHPDISFTRAVAYLTRATSKAGAAGDYGQAAAGFREALLLRPGDTEAERALEDVRLALARGSSQKGERVIETLGLGERLLLSLNVALLVWSALLGSLIASSGILLWRLGRHTTRTAGVIAGGVGGALLAVTAPLAVLVSHTAQATELAVVVEPRAPLLDERARPQKGVAPLTEAAEVRVLEARGQLVRLSLGSGTSWMRRSQLRLLRARPSQ